nr:DDB1- and CUL4-associated factor 8-like isoform X1 [Megalopta genalis]XP_033327186.1 DDB1- and CUL4-associated factor 8-like isoform X1 [Megalopta genalis]XP_033327187.1 DDB1- and CUL4-associated factor 8-like isoform X1 [Megalopta genalis]XP_033327188.1 DDB1- and CUL4-associated factor 8-like isoform X1 [Megalopta genalis]
MSAGWKDDEVGINETDVTYKTVEMSNETQFENKTVQQNDRGRKSVSEGNENKELAIVDSAMLTEPSTSQDSILPFFIDNGSTSGEQNETEGCISKDNSNGVSMENLENNSDEDSSRQRLIQASSSSSMSEDDSMDSTAESYSIGQLIDNNSEISMEYLGDSSDEDSSGQMAEVYSPCLKSRQDYIRFFDAYSNMEREIRFDNEARPKHKWFVIPELTSRERGCNPLFHRNCYGSLHVAERLELTHRLDEHQGCVNGLNFNQEGNLLASCSDDLTVIIWDWAVGKKRHIFDTGHTSNVFQSKWLPFNVEFLMTCARDGQVRLLDINRGASRNLATHSAPAHKLDIHPDTPHVVLSAGEDAKVLSIDVRDNKATELTVVRDGIYNVRLHSVQSHPMNSNEFCVGGVAPEVRIYDRRKASTPLHKLCPAHLIESYENVPVTCAVYNYNGTEILASYTNELIYLFDAVSPKLGDFVHSYDGHTNIITVKGVAFFGPKSEFVISGSDCRDIFVWDKETEVIINSMRGNKRGVTNCLETHPHIPVLATSGIRYDVKIWAPSNDHPTIFEHFDTEFMGRKV